MTTTAPQLSLEGYRALFRGTARPTEAQIAEFIDHASEMHSWYKHLHPVPPGQGFHLLLDPQSGRKWVRHGDGPRLPADVLEGDQLWHYSMRPTATYRRRFGHLQLRMDDVLGIEISDPADGGALKPVSPPPEILEAGRVSLTAVIHLCAIGLALAEPPHLRRGRWLPRERLFMARREWRTRDRPRHSEFAGRQ